MIRSMIRSMSALAALGALAAFVCLPVGAGAADPALDAPVADAAKAFEEKTGLTDFGLLMMRDEEILYRRFFGGYTETTAVPIASATKWITGATVMTLVDAGRIDLDSPVKTWLPELPSPHGDLTLRQLLSYTAGFPSLAERIDLKQDRTISLLEAAIALKDVALVDEPGTAYAYGGPNFQIAGAVVERVSGQRWADYFDEVLGDPLGMTPFFWSNPAAPVPPEKVTNPVLQGGVVTTMDAYAPFLTMIAQKGVYKGRRYLSEAAIADMETVATHGVERKFVPPGAGDTHIEYNVAHWCEVEGPDGCTMLTSPGAYGFYPWVDRASGLHGIVFIQDRLNRIAADVRALRDAMIAAQTQ